MSRSTTMAVARPESIKLERFHALMTGTGNVSPGTPAPATLLSDLSPWQNDGGPTDIHRDRVELGHYEGWKMMATVYTRKPQHSDRSRVLFLHGGAWVLGNPGSHDKLTRQIASMGYEVWSLDYPRAPRWPFPAAFNSVLKAIDKLTARASQPIILAGDSAGGGLAASAALARPEAVPALALMYPVLDYRAGFSFFSKFFSHIESSGNDPYLGSLNKTLPHDDFRINPLAHARDLPPSWVTFGELDPLATQSKKLDTLLARSGRAVDLCVAAGSGHAFMQDPEDNNVSAALASLRTFLDHHTSMPNTTSISLARKDMPQT